MSLIKLNQKAYEFNLDQIANKTGNFDRIICVFKDNAYGHGATLLAPIAKNKGINFIAVKNEQEANELKNFFDSILILSHRPNGNENLNFIYALNDINLIEKFKPLSRIHLKIDTNMHRNGIKFQDLDKAYNSILKYNLKLEGVFTHFSSADSIDDFYFKQKNNFQKVKEWFYKKCDEKLIFHSFNSAALFNSPIPEDEYCRVGLVQFGYGALHLKKVLSLYAHKLSQRILKAGESIGYSNAYTALKDLNIATYDLGYGDGLFRYDAKGELRLVNGKKILGKMSMDSFSCEDSGDEICVFDDASVWANFFNTIDYEILVKLHPGIKRIII
ncbi:alanine racemase [Campylobacter sp. TTU-622]|uniref:alanine racemase n=1 Tax=Campylobacter sp. TTU-622 TaxID=2800583 RepID=UPI001906F593|nr:alanine racemase [Campylobacter sp. TTU-622]MBK1973346.1 alanine racemase [Campylobacter sp. TTU-622]